jgi:hypothetical protein
MEDKEEYLEREIARLFEYNPPPLPPIEGNTPSKIEDPWYSRPL